MLPSNLLRAKISRGKIRPVYVGLGADTIALAEGMTNVYRSGVGKRRGELLERLKEIENGGHNFKLVRGLSTLLERRCVFQSESALDPVEARRAVFKEASNERASKPEERENVLVRVSTELGVSREVLEKALFSDLEDELILRNFRPLPSPDMLLKYYNLSVTQTLLFKALRVEFSASGNWKNIFRDVKWLGLIYSVEKDNNGGREGEFRVSLDGPLSLFKMTERYGTSIAKLLPSITAADSWMVKAEILSRSRGGKVYGFEADSKELKDCMMNVEVADEFREDERQSRASHVYDSSTEEKFAKSFLSYGTGWMLKREPEPLVTGTHVLIPDFCFEKDGMRVYLEVVGFWTPEYLRRKLSKLDSIAGDIDLVIAVDESLACSKLERLKSRALVLYYKREVPIRPIIEHLREREASLVKEQVDAFNGGETIVLKGDVVDIREIASQKGVAVTSVRMALQSFKPEGYVRVGDRFISTTKLNEIDERLRSVEKFTEALGIIETLGVKEESGKVLESLGYTTTWEGMEMDKVRISKREAAKETTSLNGN